jgi:phosphoesterase RecJ-like protein
VDAEPWVPPVPIPPPPPALLAALRGRGEWAVIPHLLPDVDALASATALCLVLLRCGCRARVYAPEVPAIYRWVLQPELLGEGEPPPHWARIGVDTARPERLQLRGDVLVNIDHHEDNPGYGALHWVEPAPACTCLVAQVAAGLGVDLDPRLATALYAGLVGDTEGFRVQATAATFGWAARFAAAGADTEEVAEAFQRRSAGFWAYLAAVEGAALDWEGAHPCRVVPIPAELPQRFALQPYENALLPSHLAPPRDGLLIILQGGREQVRFRFRSRGLDLLPLAHALGGGGHPQAAGSVMQGVSLDEALERLHRAWVEVGPRLRPVGVAASAPARGPAG